MNAECIVTISVNSERFFFKEVIDFLLNRYDQLIITLWGKIPKPVQKELLSHQLKKRGIRSRIVKEYNYVITRDDRESFLYSSNQIDFNLISWGIRINRDGIVLAKSSEDISICECDLLSIKEINKFILEPKIKTIVKNFELIKD